LARTDLTITNAPGNYADSGVALTFDAADTVNDNAFEASGNDLIIAYNSGVSDGTVTIYSVEDEKGRKGDITAETVAVGTYRIYGPFPRPGWKQADDKIYLEASTSDIQFAVVKLPK
jgi:hypothetical protein